MGKLGAKFKINDEINIAELDFHCCLLPFQVVEYFSDVVDKKGSPPYSSVFVLQTIESASMSWPKNRLRVIHEY